ncbi:HEAT repeat domain-containing protein [Pontiella agarivorans]|uniref:HEAT repeat domain-containing protein n=1 Tax=Pontiella agarivorans TaxID=3038953 RepID=A0ABU5MWU2_9BACT|nr:HEAT repeat domain-containing protein [Pontiella agarivorans]MDZ8118603.1 HEAT repeat domain-containing protein [Pontiella agarivorans]
MNLRLSTLCFVFAASVAGAQLEALKTLTTDQDQKIRRPIETLVFGTEPENFQTLENELLAIFQSPETTLEGKQYTCRLLRHCASEACVPVLKNELLNADLSAFVRMVFQGLEDDAADKALLNALPEASPELQAGIISTLSARGTPEAIAEIAPFLESENADLQFTAITALGNIGGKKAVKALAQAEVAPQFSKVWKKAQLSAVEGVKPSFFGLFSANTDKKVYAEMLTDKDPAIRSAALGAMVKADPANAADAIFQILEREDSELRKTAFSLLPQLPTESLTAVESEDPEIELLVLNELAVRREASGEAFAAEKMQRENDEVRKAAVYALGQIGGAAAFQLIPAATSDQTAFDALCAANAEGLDAAILDALKSAKDEKVKVQYINCLSDRQAEDALPEFAEWASKDWSRTCAAAISGMANLIQVDTFSTYADLLLKTDNKKKIQALEKSIAQAAQRMPDPDACAATLIAAYDKADGEVLYAVIRSLGSIGGENARGLLEQAMTSKDPLARDAAIRGLCNWPNPDVADQLLELAKNVDDDKYQLLALRGYIRLAGTSNTEAETLPMCKNAAELASRPEEIRMILSTVKRYKSEDVIQFIAPYIDNPEVVDEAGQAMIEQTWHWKFKKMAIPHLEHYVELTDNERMKAYAQQSIETAKN